MKRKIVIDGNSVYEIDENCVIEKQKHLKEEKNKKRETCTDDKE